MKIGVFVAFCFLVTSGARAANLSDELITASLRGEMDEVKRLLSRGADVNAVGDYGQTAIGVAAEKGHERLVEFLLSMNASPNPARKGEYEDAPLVNSTCGGHRKISRLLIEKGARVNRVNPRSRNSESPLGCAIKIKDPELVELLLSKGADVDLGEPPPILIAAGLGDLESVSALVNRGAKLEVENADRLTPMAVAADRGHKAVAEFLHSKDALDLRFLRNKIFAEYGKAFQAEDLRKYFESQDWYKVNPQYADALLSDDERKLVKRIQSIEDRFAKGGTMREEIYQHLKMDLDGDGTPEEILFRRTLPTSKEPVEHHWTHEVVIRSKKYPDAAHPLKWRHGQAAQVPKFKMFQKRGAQTDLILVWEDGDVSGTITETTTLRYSKGKIQAEQRETRLP